jgi:AcrR family transcriptional regulator
MAYLASTQRIVVAAAALFAKKGFRDTATREIAKYAGVNQTTIFRQFKGKHELSLAAIDHLATEANFHARLEKAINQCRPESPASAMAIVEFFIDIYQKNNDFVMIVWNAIVERQDPSADKDLRGDVRMKYTIPLRQFLQKFCQSSTDAGYLVGDPDLNSEVLYGLVIYMLQNNLVRQYNSDGPTRMGQGIKTLAQQIVYQWLNGCGVRS